MYFSQQGLDNNFEPSVFILNDCHHLECFLWPPQWPLLWGSLQTREETDNTLTNPSKPWTSVIVWTRDLLLAWTKCYLSVWLCLWPVKGPLLESFSILLPFLVARFYSSVKKKSSWEDSKERTLPVTFDTIYILWNAWQVILQVRWGRVLQSPCMEHILNR